MDHPYATGAIVGVAGGLTAAGAVTVGPVVAPYVESTASSLFNSQAAIRGAINAGLNVASQVIDDKISGNHTSAGDYGKIIGVSYVAGAWIKTDKPLVAAGAWGGANALTQGVTGDHRIDPAKVAGAAIGGGFSTWASTYLNVSNKIGTYTAQQYALGKIGWTVETPIGVISTGIRKK